MKRALAALFVLTGLACAAPFPTALPDLALASGTRPESAPRRAYRPDRRDYIAFRAAHDEILEPNYLPFMLHRFPSEEPGGDLLLLCRWQNQRMPLSVYIDTPAIPEQMQDEFHPVDSSLFADAVRGALHIWEREMEGLVLFQIVDNSADADLRVRLVSERAPEPRPEIVVLGSTKALLEACQPQGWDPDSQRLLVEFEVPELSIYVADEHGLLTPGQVERVTLHELGHALGMLGHSPDPRDLMFAAYRDWSDVETLSQADVSSFVSLYRLPNGAHYGNVPRGKQPAALPPFPPSGAPALAAAPTVDAVRGFSLRPPKGWFVAESARGVFFANGPTWDYDVSIELAFWPYDDLDEFLARYRARLLDGAWFRKRESSTVAGRVATRILVEPRDGDQVRDFRFVELGDGRLLVLIVQSPIESEAEWEAWFAASLATLQLAGEGEAWH